MGSGNWFRSIIKCKAKAARSKKAKVHSAAEKSNGSKVASNTHGEESSSNPANGGSQNNHASPPRLSEYVAATRIQTAYRAYKGSVMSNLCPEFGCPKTEQMDDMYCWMPKARKVMRRLKGAARFNVLIQGHDTQKQASTTLSYIHSWCNIQAQIAARRHHMVTEGRIKQKKLENQLKLEAKLHELEVEWCGGPDTMEEILSRIQQREEAAIKRERAMAYAFSHQWRANPTQYLGQAYYIIGKENWGWSWKERWITARPWEVRTNDRPFNSNSKKSHSRQASKSDMKPPLPTKPSLSNGKTNTKAKTSAATTNNNS